MDSKEPAGRNPSIQRGSGQGIRSLDSTTIFRITNFELFVRPNKYVMAAGLTAATFCFGYLYYWRQSYQRNIMNSETYIAVNEDDTEIIRKRSSRWE